MTYISKFSICTPVLNFISRGHQGDELTPVAACRDGLRVVSAREGSDYEDDIGSVIEEADTADCNYLIVIAVTVYRCDRTPSCGRTGKQLQQSL